MPCKLILLSSILLLQGCSTPQQAVGLDAVTTVGGLASTSHLTETNPAGLLSIPYRAALLTYSESLPPSQKEELQNSIEATSLGAGVWNATLFLTGAYLPALIVGSLVAIHNWNSNSDSREFARMCEIHRNLSKNPNLVCNFKPTKA